MRSLVFLLSACLLVGCSSHAQDVNAPATVGHVDLQRYQGTWYEQARLPMFFQRDCIRSQARYRLLEGGKVEVVNRCERKDGTWKEARGEAEPQEPGVTDRLWVRFDSWFGTLFPGLAKGHYWVLYLDQEYDVALVGSPDREYLWLLSREEQLEAARRDRLLEEAQKRGYDTSGLIWRGEAAAR